MLPTGTDNSSLSTATSALVAVDSEELSVPVGSIGSAVERWRSHIGPERIARNKIDESEQRAVYLFKGGDGEMFAGYEGVAVNGRMTYCSRSFFR